MAIERAEVCKVVDDSSWVRRPFFSAVCAAADSRRYYLVFHYTELYNENMPFENILATVLQSPGGGVLF